MEKNAKNKSSANGNVRKTPALKKTAYDKRELRARVEERKVLLEGELARLKAVVPQTTSTPDQDAIAASLAALTGMLASAGDAISEVTAAELSRWLDSTPYVAVEKTHGERDHTN